MNINLTGPIWKPPPPSANMRLASCGKIKRHFDRRDRREHHPGL